MPEPKQLITVEGKKTTFTPPADLTASSVPDLRGELKRLVAEGARELVFDLCRVEVVDSTGIGLLVSLHNTLARLEGRLSVVNASDNLVELFKAFRLDRHFTVNGK